jgi:hypothetical protein
MGTKRFFHFLIMRRFPYLASGKLRIARNAERRINPRMGKMVPPDEIRRRLLSALEAHKALASAEGKRPTWTAASLGRELGDKDHIRDFLISRKESLSAETLLGAERALGLAHGALHLPKPIVGSFDPDALDDTPDPDAESSAATFPADAIKELAAKPGMGSGQTVETTYTRDGDQIVQRDAVLDDYWRLPPDFVRGDLKTSVANLLVVNCRGDSMEPTLRAGDRLLVDTSDKQPSGDRIFAIRDQLGEIVVKRLRLVGHDPIRIQIVSDNPTVDNIEEAFELVPIVGRVVAGLKLF